MAKAKWLGPLGKRIEPNRWPVLDPIWKVDLRAIEEDRIFRERIEKLPLLLDHFKIARVAHAEQISGGDLLKLALALAIDFVEGFKLAKKPRPKRGPKGPNWKGADGEALVSEVQALVAHNQISINKAIQMIIELAPERYGDYPPEDLKNRYYEARKRHTNRRQNAL